jgi:hypothetical protein
MRIILVTRDSVFGRFVAAELTSAGAVDRVIIETRAPSLRFLRRRLLRVGPFNFALQAALGRHFRVEGIRQLGAPSLPSHTRVHDVNTCTFSAMDLVLGFGTSYVTAATLARLPNGMLNLHTGYLPDYRGVKSEFWALHNEEPERAGWTLHFMTPELDAGDIVLQRRVPASDGESPGSLRARLVRDAIPAIAALVRRVRREGTVALERRPQDHSVARYYSAPEWRDWWRWRRRERAAVEAASARSSG